MDAGTLLLRCEALSGRLEGILLADPDLALLWRTETALIEAANSVGLEGERISTSGMVLRLTGTLAIAEEARATEMALRILSVIKRPGNIFNAPVETIRRIETVSLPIGRSRDETDRLEDKELSLIVREGQAWSDAPVLAGLRAAAAYAFRSRRESPIAERLIFMAVESACRHLRGLSSDRQVPAGGDMSDDEDGQGALLMPTEAGWIITPSTAMTRNGLRIWSPLSGVVPFLDAACRALAQDLGHLGTLRHELSCLNSVVTYARGRSRLGDLAALLRQQPVVNSAMVCNRLGVSRRTSLALIAEMEEANCLLNVTSRRAARFWALPSLAARMKSSGPLRREMPKRLTPQHPVTLDETSRPGHLRGQFDESRLNRIMNDLDAAMASLDAVVRNKPGDGSS